MAKNVTPAMRAHLDGETTRLAAIWRITRKDGAQFFFTAREMIVAKERGRGRAVPASRAGSRLATDAALL